MEISPVTIHDAGDISRIADANGLIPWSWPEDCHGGVAKEKGKVVAFCAIKEVKLHGQALLALEEFWCEPSRAGRRGLSALGDFIEDTAQRLATERGTRLKVGGFVNGEGLEEALLNRSYHPESGVLLTKTFHPEAKEAVA